MDKPKRRRGAGTIIVGALLLIVLVLFLVTFQVRVNESAIVFTFGRAASSPLLCEEDFKNLGGLVLKLRAAGDPLSAHIWKSFSVEIQRALAEYSAALPLSEGLKRGVIEDLNRLLKTESLSDGRLFEHIALPEKLLTSGKLRGEELIHRNRQLLAQAYPQEISRVPHSGAITRPGLYLKWPYPIQTAKIFDSRVHVFETKSQEVYTADGKNLIVTLAIGWSIENPVKYNESVPTREKARDHIGALVGSAANAVIGQHRFGEFVSVDEERLAFDAIENEMTGAVRQTAESDYGIRLEFVRFSQLSLPDEVLKSVYSRMEAERARIAKKYRSEGSSEADKIRALADQVKADLLSEAEAEATRLRGEGDAAAAVYYAVFKDNPELAIFLRRLDSLRRLKGRSTIVLDTSIPPYNLFRADTPIPGGGKETESHAPTTDEPNE